MNKSKILYKIYDNLKTLTFALLIAVLIRSILVQQLIKQMLKF